MNKNKCYRVTAGFLVFTLLLPLLFHFNVSAKEMQSTETTKLTVIHVNDRHSRTQADPYVSAIANYLEALDENVLVLDAGDSLHGQTTAILTKGESIVEIMNVVGYDAMVPGNHEFNYGTVRLVELSNKMNFPLLAANIKNKDTNTDFLENSYKTVSMNGLTVGIFGIATPETKTKSDPRVVENLDFVNPANASKTMVDKLESEGCDVVIALAHLGDSKLSEAQDKSDAIAAVPGIDLIIDGHSHTVLEQGREVDGSDSLIVQTGEHGNNIGIVEIEIEDNKVVNKKAQLATVPALQKDEAGNYQNISFEIDGDPVFLLPDEDIIQMIASQNNDVQAITSQVVGYTPVLLQGDRFEVRTKETNLGDLISDSMRYATEADIAFLTGGNIRASIEPGNITMGQVLDVLPWSNQVVTIEVSGNDVLKMLEHGVSGYPEEAATNIQISGLSFEFDPSVSQNRVQEGIIMENGKAFSEEDTYVVATIDFLAVGGDGYSMLENAENLTYYKGDIEAFFDYLEYLDDAGIEINAEPAHRITKSSYHVKFDANGGTNLSTASMAVAKGEAIGKLPTVTRTGHTFKGWYTQKNGGSQVLDTTNITSNQTLFARWEIQKYTVTFDKNEGTELSKSNAIVAYNNQVGKLPTVKRKGYTFKGWYTQKSGGSKVGTTTKITGNQTFYARWAKVTKPAKVKISSLKSKKSKQAVIKLKKVSEAKGYQIVYSTSSKFKSSKKISTTSRNKTIKGLKKGKTYYVKARAYKVDSMNKKVYGKYSAVKKVKIKK